MAGTLEHLNAKQLQYRLNQLGARFEKERSTNVAYIYSTPTGVWVKVKPGSGTYEVTYHNQCPCALS